MTEPLERHVQAARIELQRSAWTDEHVAGAWRELATRRERDETRQRRVKRIAVPAFAVAAAVGLTFVALGTLSPDGAGGTSRLAAEATPSLVIGDGMEATFDRSARVSVDERTDQRVVVTLGAGKAGFRVRHDPTRLFRVRAGEVAVEDLGTTFEVDNDGSVVRVVVSEGSVAVSFPEAGGSRGRATLKAGERGVYPAMSASSGAKSGDSATAAPAGPAASADEPRAANPPPATGWRELARGGKHGRAYELLAPGGFSDVRDEPGDLLLASDAARLSQHPREAVNLLRKLLARHQGDPRAPSAAFTLGWLLMQELGRPREAAAAFARAEALAPRGNLAEDAMARSVEAWHRSGDVARAKREVDRYRKSYPRGRHLAMLEGLVGKP